MKRSIMPLIAASFLSILFIGSIALVSCGGGGGGGSTAALSAPSNVKVTRGAAKDTVTWNAVSGAAKYKVYATKPASSARISTQGGPSVHENTNCGCSWQSMTCTSDAPAGSTCQYCETTNTCADFDHAPADINESYQITCTDSAGKESAKSDSATDDSGSSSGGTSTSSSGGSTTSSSGGSTTSSSGSSGSTLPPSMSLSCVGVTHYSGYSVITVCVNLTNVDGGDWSNFTATRGSTPADSYSYTYNSELQTFLTKVCSTFRITQYGAYSGAAGISTGGGSAALTWDINVTSAEQACQ